MVRGNSLVAGESEQRGKATLSGRFPFLRQEQSHSAFYQSLDIERNLKRDYFAEHVSFPNTKMLFSVVLALAILFYLAYRFFVYPAFLSPLSAIPNAHFSSSFSNGWMIWQRYHRQTNKAIHDAHKRLGAVVRLGLTEISVNSPEALKVVYSGYFEKDDFYAPFTNYGYIANDGFLRIAELS